MKMDCTPELAIIGLNVAFMTISIGSTITLFLWARSEARHDQAQIRDLIVAIHAETKDFHGRLCAIEERKKGN